MQVLSKIRDQMYDHFQRSQSCQNYFHGNEARFAQYYTSMFLLQDTTESLEHHRAGGFSSHPLSAYLELWGILQAIIIQQDALGELHDAICDAALDTSKLDRWVELRTLRNTIAGHPAKQNRPKSNPLARSFVGRSFGGYDRLTYERWDSTEVTTHPTVKFGKLLEKYSIEAEQVALVLLNTMRQKWP